LPQLRLHVLAFTCVCEPSELCGASRVMHSRGFPLNTEHPWLCILFLLQVTVEQKANGAQTIRLTTPLQAGKLLLHWGVEGGKVC